MFDIIVKWDCLNENNVSDDFLKSDLFKISQKK